MSCVTDELKEAVLPFYKESGMCDQYKDDQGLEEVVEAILEKSSYVKDYDVFSSTMFDSPGYACGYVIASWVEIDNTLHTVPYEWDTN